MDEIVRVPSNGLKVVSTFSGAGGSTLGYRIAGFKVAYANEFIEEARATYLANNPLTLVDPRDIREVKAGEILTRLQLSRGELDLLDGSPPCSSFSTAGARQKNWGKTKKYSDGEQRTDDLFFEYVRLLKDLQPRAFVAENVSGLAIGKAKGYFLQIYEELERAGYRVGCKLLDAKWLGVPQGRKRLIFVGARLDLGLEPAFPDPLKYFYSIEEAIAGVGGRDHDPTECSLERYAIGREWEKLKPGEQSAKYFSLIRPHPSLPCPTITATAGNIGAASVTHPHEKRKFTVAELKRLASFPDDFVLTGSYEQRVERIGRSVPPLMMARIAAAVRDGILKR